MAMSKQEAAGAYRAGMRYIDLCDAYRATSVAHVIVLDRIEQGIRNRADRLSTEAFNEGFSAIAERRSSSQRSYATFVTRRLQALSRLEELMQL